MNNLKNESNELYQAAKYLKNEGCIYQYFEDEIFSGRSVKINGKELIHFANCCYLGIECNNKMIEAGISALKNHGTQNSMSRAMMSSPLYKKLELLLSKIFPGNQIICPTVTLGHCSALPILIGAKDAIILDAYVHNSVRMASQLCKSNGTMVLISKHNDMEHVKYLTYRLKKDGYENIWYCADGIYSMHGDFCDVKGLAKLLDEEEDLYAYVDDAHGTGCFGKNGSGYVIGTIGLHPKMIVMNSFAKSFGVAGGCLVIQDDDIADLIRLTGQTMIFSGPIQPANLGALIASAELHLSDELPSMQNELTDLIQHFRRTCLELGLPIVTMDESPIQLLRIGNMELTYQIHKLLMEKGFIAMAVVFPAVSKGDEGIRISLTRHLTRDDISNFLKLLVEIMEPYYEVHK